MRQTFLLWGTFDVTRLQEQGRLLGGSQTAAVQIRLLPGGLAGPVGCTRLGTSVVFLPFCSSGLGVTCFSLSLEARAYGWNEATVITSHTLKIENTLMCSFTQKERPSL